MDDSPGAQLSNPGLPMKPISAAYQFSLIRIIPETNPRTPYADWACAGRRGTVLAIGAGLWQSFGMLQVRETCNPPLCRRKSRSHFYGFGYSRKESRLQFEPHSLV